MSEDTKGLLLIVCPTIACLPAVWWLLSNPPPENMTSPFAQRLRAKRSGRIWFWYVAGILLGQFTKIWLNPSFRSEWGHVGLGCLMAAVPLAVLAALAAYGCILVVRSAEGPADQDADPLACWRFFSGRGLVLYAVVMILSFLVLGK